MAVKGRNHEAHSRAGSEIRDIILGWQDGLVNVLGVVLAVAAATIDTKTVIIAGLAATFAESISMAAVAYTSTKAERDYYRREVAAEREEIEKIPAAEKKEVRNIYYRKGFRGRSLNIIVNKITSKKGLWLKTMMSEELGLSNSTHKPANSAMVVGLSAMVGSLFPLLPFLLMQVATGIPVSIVTCIAVLFCLGAAKAKVTVGNWMKSGLEIAIIGLAAALVGYGIGAVLGSAVA